MADTEDDALSTLLSAAKHIAVLLEGIRDDQATPDFGSTAEARAERKRVIDMYIRANAGQIDDALERLLAAIAKVEAR